MDGVGAPRRSDIPRQLNIVTVALEQPDEQRLNGIVIEVQSHSPRASRSLANRSSTSRYMRTRSWGESGRGLG
jgi:hypothetical protein